MNMEGQFIIHDRSKRDDILVDLIDDFLSHSKSINSDKDFSKIANDFSVEDIVYASETYSRESRSKIFSLFDNFDDKIIFLRRSDFYTRKIILQSLQDQEIANIISSVPIDQAVKIVEPIPSVRTRKIMSLIDDKKSKIICSHMIFDPDTAGRFMDGEFFAFNQNVTVGEALSYIKQNPEIDLLRRVFVVNESNVVSGFVPSRALLTNQIDVYLYSVMRSIEHFVAPDESLQSVVEIFERYKVGDLPVVNSTGNILGVITYDDLIEYIEDKTDKTISLMSGTESEAQSRHTIIGSILSRMPWLTITLASGLMNAGNISSLPKSCKLLVYFIPLINGMSGNVGLQCSTVIVRGLAAGFVNKNSVSNFAFREMMTGSASGLLFGVLCGVVVFVVQYFFSAYGSNFTPLNLSVVVCSGLTGACMFATVLGVAFPIIFDRVGVDPAIASGPIVTAINDVCSTLMYLIVSSMIISIIGT